MTRLSLKLGLCATNGGGCALEKSSCDDPDTWLSPSEMIGNPSYQGHGDICLLASVVRERVLGRCGGDPDDGASAGRCAPNRESCQNADAPFFDDRVPFEEANAECTVEETTFGTCGDRCSWSPRDCGPGEEWSFPAEGCSYSKVRTGGCVRGDGSGPGDVYCAVSEGGCDEDRGWTWLSPLEMATTATVDTECYVGMELTAPVEGQGVPMPVAGSKARSREGSSPSPSIVIGAAVGGSLLVALLASLLITRQFKKQKRHSKSAEAELTETDSDATSIIGLDLKLESSANDEVVSNLDVEDLESSHNDEVVSNIDVEDVVAEVAAGRLNVWSASAKVSSGHGLRISK